MSDTKYWISHKDEHGNYHDLGTNTRFPVAGVKTLNGAKKRAESSMRVKDGYRIEDAKTGKVLHEHAGKSAHAEEAHPLRVKHSDMHKVAEELRHEHGAVHSHDPIYQHSKKNK